MDYASKKRSCMTSSSMILLLYLTYHNASAGVRTPTSLGRTSVCHYHRSSKTSPRKSGILSEHKKSPFHKLSTKLFTIPFFAIAIASAAFRRPPSPPLALCCHKTTEGHAIPDNFDICLDDGTMAMPPSSSRSIRHRRPLPPSPPTRRAPFSSFDDDCPRLLARYDDDDQDDDDARRWHEGGCHLQV